MKLPILLSAAASLAASVGASTFRPRNIHGYLPHGARANSFEGDVVPSTKRRDAVAIDAAARNERREGPLSLRGGDAVARNADVPTRPAVAGVAIFTAMTVAVDKLFVALGVVFPAMLACTILVFAGLSLAECLSPGRGDAMHRALTPGADLLTKWLPVLFVPGLVLLPLAPSVGSARDVAGVISVIILGFFYSMGTTAFVVQSVRRVQGLLVEEGDVEEPAKEGPVIANAPTGEAPPPPPAQELMEDMAGEPGGEIPANANADVVTDEIPPPPPEQFTGIDQGSLEEMAEEPANEMPANESEQAVTVGAPPPPPKPFTDRTYQFFLRSTLLTGAVSVAATNRNARHAVPLRALFMSSGTFLAYVAAARLPPAFNKVVHPLITGTVGTLLLTGYDALVTGGSLKDVLRTYKRGSLSPSKAGAGDLLVFLLGPAIACLGIPMYSRRAIMAANLPAVLAGALCSGAGGLFGTALYARLLDIGACAAVRLSLLPRNVTTGLAIVIAEILGGNVSFTCAVVVLTGIFGATVGRGFLDVLNVRDPVSRGLGMGGSGQGLGVTAMLPEEEAFPFAVINMVLTGVCTTALVSVPAVRELVLRIVSGGFKGATENIVSAGLEGATE